MEFTGTVSGISQDFSTGYYTIAFRVDADKAKAVLSAYDEIKDLDKLAIKAVKYRRKRSLDANAYAWVLLSKISEVLNTSKDDVYEEMLRRYGTLYEDEEGYITVTVKASVDMGKIEGHWLLIKDNGSYKAYAMIKGSSEYDSGEMSRFIDGLVSEAKELGIETLTPRELEEMKGSWKL